MEFFERVEGDDVPSDTSVLELWQPLAIDALTVHLPGDNQVLVRVPVMQR